MLSVKKWISEKIRKTTKSVFFALIKKEKEEKKASASIHQNVSSLTGKKKLFCTLQMLQILNIEIFSKYSVMNIKLKDKHVHKFGIFLTEDASNRSPCIMDLAWPFISQMTYVAKKNTILGRCLLIFIKSLYFI